MYFTDILTRDEMRMVMDCLGNQEQMLRNSAIRNREEGYDICADSLEEEAETMRKAYLKLVDVWNEEYCE